MSIQNSPYDWKEMFWEGGCKLTERGGQLTLAFIDSRTSAIQTFVNLPDNPYEAIEKTVDSQRGYAVRLVTPTGGHQWVGCVFRDRNDAFDFNEKILKFISDRDMERNPEKFKSEFQPQQDFSLKTGQKIQISLGENQSKKPQQQKGSANLSDFKFAPPPDFSDFGQFAQPQAQTQQQPAQDPWGSFGQASWRVETSLVQNVPQKNTQSAFQQQNQFPVFQQPPTQFGMPQQQQQQQKGKTNEVNLLDL